MFHYSPSLWEFFSSAKPKGQGLVTDYWSSGQDSLLSLPRSDLTLWPGTEALLQAAIDPGSLSPLGLPLSCSSTLPCSTPTQALGFSSLRGLEKLWTVSRGFPGGSDGKESACHAGGPGLILGLGRSPGEGNGNPLQYSCLENPIDRGGQRATVRGVAESRTRLSTHACRDRLQPSPQSPMDCSFSLSFIHS